MGQARPVDEGSRPHSQRSGTTVSLRSNSLPWSRIRCRRRTRRQHPVALPRTHAPDSGGGHGRQAQARGGATGEAPEGRTMTRRTRRSIAGSVLVVLGLVIGAVVVTALQAEGRERSKADTNDGGAWLLKRDAGYVGHVNRQVGEVTAAVSVADPGSDFDVDQAPGIIVVHDRTTGVVTVVDDSVERVANPAGVRVGQDVTVHAVDGGALIVDRSSMSVWKLTREQLLSVASTDEVEALVTGEGAHASAATPDGHAVVADEAAGNVVFLDPDGTTDVSPDVELTDDVVSITSLGADTAVLADPDGDLVLATPDRADAARHRRARRRRQRLARRPAAAAAPAADRVVAATTDGRLVADPARRRRDRGRPRSASSPGPRRRRRSCSAAACSPCRRRRRRSRQWCADGAGGWTEVQQAPLDGAGSELRLRLVNGWVWINDVDTGAAWVTSPQQRLDRVEDWGSILSRLERRRVRRQHRRRGRRGHHRGQPGRPERRDRAVGRDRRGGPEQAADRPRRHRPDPRRPADRHRRAAQRHRPQRRRPRRRGGRADRRRRARADRPGRAQRAGLAGGRLRRHDHVRLHDHRRPRRQRVGRRDGAGRARPTAAPTGRPRRTTTSPRRAAAARRRSTCSATTSTPTATPSSSTRSPSRTPPPPPASSCPTRPARSCSRPTRTRRRSASS